MKKEDGRLKLKYCNNSSCNLYQKDMSKNYDRISYTFCPICGNKLFSNER